MGDLDSVWAGQQLDAVVVGAGQAGLAIGWHLRQLGASFVVLEAASQIGSSWRSRWDSLRLFTPARYDALPGMPFPGDPDHHPTKDEVADYLIDYAQQHRLPLRLDTRVERLRRVASGFEVATSRGTVNAKQVVVASGAFQTPVVPTLAGLLDPAVVQLHSSGYRNARQLPEGPVMVVGAGSSGIQLAEELASSHEVTIAVGTPPRSLPQQVLGRDVFWWLSRSGILTRPAESLLVRRLRRRAEPVIGVGIDDLRAAGVRFSARVIDVDGRRVLTSDGRAHTPSTILWATGFRPDWSWLEVPVRTAEGGLEHVRGVTREPGLYFLGLPWQHSRGSSLLGFVRHDAEFIASRLTVGAAHRETTTAGNVPDMP